jgi:hypothetical protein
VPSRVSYFASCTFVQNDQIQKQKDCISVAVLSRCARNAGAVQA